MWYVNKQRPAFGTKLHLTYDYSMTLKLLTEHHLEFLSLKGGCTGSSGSTPQSAALLEITCHGSFVKYGPEHEILILVMHATIIG